MMLLLSQLHWLRHAPALDPCSSSSIMHAPVAAVKNETTPITELNQQRASMKRPDEETGFSDAVPTRLTKCGGLHSNWHWDPCS